MRSGFINYRVHKFIVKVDGHNSTVIIHNISNSLKELSVFLRSLDRDKIAYYSVDFGNNNLTTLRLFVKCNHLKYFISKDIIPERMNFV